jgi:hypothetical protein
MSKKMLGGPKAVPLAHVGGVRYVDAGTTSGLIDSKGGRSWGL